MSNPAESYESYMVPALFRPWALRLLQLANVQPGDRVLDLACGTGIVARLVASQLGSQSAVTGVDLNPAMLEVARAMAAQENVVVDWHEGRAEQLPFPDGSFDFVLCQFGLMFFADRSAALAESGRVLQPDGRIFLAVWQGLDRHPFYEKLHGVIERRAGISALKDIFALGDADELRQLLGHAGFRGVEIEPASMSVRFPNPEAFLAGEIDVDTAAIPALQSLEEEERKAILAAISEAMRPALLESIRAGHVELPFHALIAHATR